MYLLPPQESILEIEDSGQRSDYSLEFDDEPDSPVLEHRGQGQGQQSQARDSIGEFAAASAAKQQQRLQRQEAQDGGRGTGGGGLAYRVTGDGGISELYSHR